MSKNSLKNISTVSFEIVDFLYSKLPPHFIKLDLNNRNKVKLVISFECQFCECNSLVFYITFNKISKVCRPNNIVL